MENNNLESFDIILEAGKSEKNYWLDIWRFRELFYILSWRDVKVRYKQAVLGTAWSVIRPFLTMIIFTFIFSKLAKLPTEGDAPYAIMVFAGMLPWYFFANSLSESSNSLIGNANLISKVYFPRIIIPVSTVIVSLTDFLISFGILIVMFIYYQFIPSVNILLMPIFLVLIFFISMGMGLLLTALNVRYRDFRYIVPFIIQIGFYISPVGFSSTIIPEKYRLFYYLNPMAGAIDSFRWSIIGNETNLYLPGLFSSIAISAIFTLIGISYFRKVEKKFADFI